VEGAIMSNVHTAEKADSLGCTPRGDHDRLLRLALRWKEIASSDAMRVRKSQWKSLHDLRPARPMILFETFSVSGYLDESDLKCETPLLRDVERTMLESIKHFEELGDDIVLEEHFRIPWKIGRSSYGVDIIETHAENSIGYKSNFPIADSADLSALRPRSFGVDRKASLRLKEVLGDIFGATLPVLLGNYDNFFPDIGFAPFTGNNFIGITMDVFKLIGNENMMLWPYDCPDRLHELMRFLTDDRLAFFAWIEREGLLDANTDNQFAGPSSYGYTSELPGIGSKTGFKLADVWGWAESQETTQVSPSMFEEFFLPYIAEVGNLFGKTYYGCCEPVDDRFDLICKALPNLRTVSVSGWNDFGRMGDLLGGRFVYSRKPTPAFISGSYPDWERAEKDLAATYRAARDGCLELIVRDVYDVGGDLSRLKRWVDLAKKTMQL